MYGTQTREEALAKQLAFENDVKMYGTQTAQRQPIIGHGLRMM